MNNCVTGTITDKDHVGVKLAANGFATVHQWTSFHEMVDHFTAMHWLVHELLFAHHLHRNHH